MKILQREPALLVGLVQTLLALAVSFGLSLSAEQVGAIMAAAAAVLAFVTRQAVVSPQAAVDLAASAATRTAIALNQDTAGVAGSITERGEALAETVVTNVAKGAGGVIAQVVKGG